MIGAKMDFILETNVQVSLSIKGELLGKYHVFHLFFQCVIAIDLVLMSVMPLMELVAAKQT